MKMNAPAQWLMRHRNKANVQNCPNVKLSDPRRLSRLGRVEFQALA